MVISSYVDENSSNKESMDYDSGENRLQSNYHLSKHESNDMLGVQCGFSLGSKDVRYYINRDVKRETYNAKEGSKIWLSEG